MVYMILGSIICFKVYLNPKKIVETLPFGLFLGFGLSFYLLLGFGIP